ncbi:ThiF family adenylyltransferase [Paenibacillus terreus]|uniref:ThiF family adenylyltransferase n=1 Tax=Paenibacillus terreus TaxID=1387834 RepID=A0ABV5BC40_9BACL
MTEEEIESLVNELLDNEILTSISYDRENRYSRHHLYFDMIGLDPQRAQEVLSKKKVGLIGMGGIGSNVAMNLAGAGIGTLVFSDGDTIETSNLTRQFLYNESHVGKLKVETAVNQLSRLNSTIKLIPVVESIAGEDLFERHFYDCDFIVLSADSPMFIHEWINNAALRYGFAYSNAGYIESFGVVGPLVIPGVTSCYECYKKDGDLYRFSDDHDELNTNLNTSYQAPSYGPLNALVASIQANEVIRYLLGEKTKSAGNRLLINSENYRIYEEKFERNMNCPKCSHVLASADTPSLLKRNKTLSEIYTEERENNSFNFILLDNLMDKLVKIRPNTRILDVGCATGEQTLRFAAKGAHVVANDISREMLDLLEAKISPHVKGLIQTLHGDIEYLNVDGQFDYIVCNNILDYLADIKSTIHKFYKLLNSKGTLIVSLPHPIKNVGFWKKEFYNGKWNYEEFNIMGYFEEGKITKSRENKDGEVVVDAIETYHRTTESYFQAFVQAGFQVVSLLEPKPTDSYHVSHPILFEKCSKIPYFQVFVLKRGNV